MDENSNKTIHGQTATDHFYAQAMSTIMYKIGKQIYIIFVKIH